MTRIFIASALLMMTSFSTLRGQDQWKNVYTQSAWAARDQWQRADALIKYLNLHVGSQVADVGCHEGYMTFKLSTAVGNQGRVYAVDLDLVKLDKLKAHQTANKITNILTIHGDPDNPKLPVGKIDAVIILDTYHEMRDHDKILRHIKANLKPGGRLVLCEPIAEERRLSLRANQEAKHEVGMKFVQKDLENIGFKILYSEDHFVDRTKEKGDQMWLIVAVR